MVFRKTLVFGILFAYGLLPATAKYELPRPRYHPKKIRAAHFIDTPFTLKPDQERYFEEDSYIARRDDKIYILTLDPDSSLSKQLERLPLQNINDDSSETGLPEKKTLAMLPLINYETSSEENDIDFGVKSQLNGDRWKKLLDSNGMLYLNPKRVKSALRSDTTYMPEWDKLNTALNRGLEVKIKERAPEPNVYNFSDLVL